MDHNKSLPDDAKSFWKGAWSRVMCRIFKFYKYFRNDLSLD